MSINKKYISILSVATAMLLSACSSDNSEVQTVSADAKPVGEDILVMAYAPPFASADPTDDPEGFSPYTPDKTTSMGIYMLLPADWASPKEEKLTYTNKWHAYFDVTPDKTYTVYGYMPKTGEMSSTLTKSATDAATLTISNIKPITTDDICIITGVKEADEGLKEGQFSWYWPVGDDNYKIHILMDHLYAAALFSMKIDAEYAELRTIKLKTMKLKTNTGSIDATISLTHNTTGASPVSDDVTYSASDGNSTAEIFNSEEGVALDVTTPVEISACFAPTLSESLTMVTTYDVYDRKGNLIRKGCSATNKLPNLEAVRAQQVQLNLTVNPTYLNVLSDYDLDNPTVK